MISREGEKMLFLAGKHIPLPKHLILYTLNWLHEGYFPGKKADYAFIISTIGTGEARNGIPEGRRTRYTGRTVTAGKAMVPGKGEVS